MTNKVELNTLTQVVHKEQAFLTALNENFLRLQQAINDTLSRSGVVPNQMEEVLDMNGKRIINAGPALEDNDVLTKAYIADLIAEVEQAVARAETVVNQAIAAVELYASENIYPVAQAAVDDAVAAKDAAKGYADDAKDYYDDTKDLYDDLADVRASLSSLLELYDNLSYVINVSNNMTDVQAVSNISSDVQAVSGISSDVQTVSGISSDVSAVASNETNINTVAGDISDVSTVAESITNVDTVASNISVVSDVADNETNINTVAAGIADVNTVAGISSEVSSVANNITDINTVAADHDNIGTVVSNMAAINAAPTYAAQAKQWAIGDPSEPANGSAKYWAERAHVYTEGVLHEDLITNCITEVPQDINLTLSNGTLTLKSGSIVTFADGSQYQTTSDASMTSSTVEDVVVVWDKPNRALIAARKSRCVSGATDPLVGTPFRIWYDTTNNKVWRYGGSDVDVREVSLPLCICSQNLSSILQVFNGAGYIGNSVFILPGLETLNPCGFNSDGTLKSYTLKVNSLLIATRNSNNNDLCLRFNASSIGFWQRYKEVNTLPETAYNGDVCYLKSENANYYYSNGWNKDTQSWFIGFKCKKTDDGITDFKVPVPVRLVTTEMLGTAAYTDSTDYATASQGAKADTALQNTATGTDSLTIAGTAATTNGSVNIGASSRSNSGYSASLGYGAQASYLDVSIGCNAVVGSSRAVGIGGGSGSSEITLIDNNSNYAIAIGSGARISAYAPSAIQLGKGTNATAGTMQVSLSTDGTTFVDYLLLDATGEVPTGRYKVMTGADGVNAGTKGVVPAPTATDNNKFLRGDGTWAECTKPTYDSLTKTLEF